MEEELLELTVQDEIRITPLASSRLASLTTYLCTQSVRSLRPLLHGPRREQAPTSVLGRCVSPARPCRVALLSVPEPLCPRPHTPTGSRGKKPFSVRAGLVFTCKKKTVFLVHPPPPPHLVFSSPTGALNPSTLLPLSGESRRVPTPAGRGLRPSRGPEGHEACTLMTSPGKTVQARSRRK